MSPRPLALDPTAAQEMDRLAEEDYHLPLGLMMENAGRTLAALTARVAGPEPRRALVLAGKGGNGGGALVGARHLLNAGWDVEVGLAVPMETLVAAGYLQYEMLRTTGAAVRDGRTEPIGYDEADVIIDGLLGYHARGEPRPPMPELIAGANAADAHRIALDVPTGIDPGSGAVNGAPFQADATLMLALPKTGVITGDGPRFAGELWLGDIAFPAPAYEKIGAARPVFDEAGLARFTP